MTATVLVQTVLPSGVTTYQSMTGEVVRIHPINPFPSDLYPPAARREESNNTETVPGDAVMKEHSS